MLVKLGDISTIRTGLVTARKKATVTSSFKKEYRQITLKSFSPNCIKLNKSYIDTFISSSKIESKYFSKEGDIIVRLRTPNFALYIDKDDEGLLVNSLLATIYIKNKNLVNAKYIAYYLHSSFATHLMKFDMRQTTIPMLKTKDLENLQVVLPPFKEQEKLVNFLDSAKKEEELLIRLAQQKSKLAQQILNKSILKNKENSQ